MRGRGLIQRHSNATRVVRAFWNSRATISLRMGNQEVLADGVRVVQMKISAIIINYESGEYLGKCIGGLLRYLKQDVDEIIIVDNDSKDGSLANLDNRAAVRCIELKENVGYGGGCNIGCAETTGDILLFLNPDVVLQTPIENIRGLFERYDHCAIITPSIVDVTGQRNPHVSRRAFPTVFDDAISEFKYLKPKRKKAKSYSFEGNIFYEGFSNGCALFVRKKAFEEVGGFDDKYFLYYEEVDLFKRLHNLGYTFIHEPRCRVAHVSGGSSDPLGWERNAIGYNSKLRYFSKHASKQLICVHRILNLLILFLKIIATLLGTLLGILDARKIRAYVYAIKLYIFGYTPWVSGRTVMDNCHG